MGRQKTKGKGKARWVFINHVNHNGKWISRRIGDKKAAETATIKIRAKLQLGEFEIDEGGKRISRRPRILLKDIWTPTPP